MSIRHKLSGTFFTVDSLPGKHEHEGGNYPERGCELNSRSEIAN
jgi:hypothetical protein